MDMEKSKLSISIDSKLVEWIDKKIEDKTFANRSHALEYAVNFIKKLE